MKLLPFSHSHVLGCHVTILKKKLFVLGGYDPNLGGTETKSTEIYDFEEDKWTAGPEMPEFKGKGFAAEAVSNHEVFITAGTVNSYIYNFETESWTEKAPMNQDGMAWRSFVESGFIRLADGTRTVIVIGGLSNISPTYLTRVDRYNVDMDTWTRLN